MSKETREEITTVSTVHPKQVIKSTTVSPAPDPGEKKEYVQKKTIFRFYQIIWYVLGLIEILLGFRFALKAMGANPFSGFSQFIYAISKPFAHPFLGIISASISGANVVEWSTLIAMIVYLIIAYILVEFFQLVKPVSREEVEQTVDET